MRSVCEYISFVFRIFATSTDEVTLCLSASDGGIKDENSDK